MTKATYPKPKFCLSLEACEKLYNLLSSRVFAGYPDSLPTFSSRFPGRLESILNSAKLKADLLDHDVFQVAANYYVSINRGHPFQNGNKRLSVLLSDVFLILHGYETSIKVDAFLEISIVVNTLKMPDEEIKHEIAELFKSSYKYED